MKRFTILLGSAMSMSQCVVKEWKMVNFKLVCDMDIVDPSRIQDACQTWTGYMASLSMSSPQLKWIERPLHRFESCRRLRFFLCITLVICWSFRFHNISIILKLKRHKRTVNLTNIIFLKKFLTSVLKIIRGFV